MAGSDSQLYAQVAVDVAAPGTDRLFTYRVPEDLSDLVRTGSRVRVPFGRRWVDGFVIRLSPESSVEQVKDIESVAGEAPFFGPDELALAEWMADRYLCLFVQALRCLIPPGARGERVRPLVRRMVRLREAHEEAYEEGHQARDPRESRGAQRMPRSARMSAVAGVVAAAAAEAAVSAEPPGGGAPCDAPPSAQQLVLLEFLRRRPGLYTRSDLARAAGVGMAAIRGLLERGILEEVRIEVRRDPYGRLLPAGGVASGAPERKPELTPGQAQAVAAIGEAVEAGSHRVFLLHGVTGSGKTEVYLRAIEKTLAAGRQAVVLVPEIALTPQMVAAFRGRFGERVAMLHSALSAGERYDEWRRIRSGEVAVAVGARSAVFAPFNRLGLIVVDEEHENTYKQGETPRYHAREVAVERARLSGAAVVLGSATPAVETYRAAETGAFTLLQLPRRIDDRPLPDVRIVDMREELAGGNRRIFSALLEQAVRERLARREQVILFLNRRGYHTFVICRECGFVLRCPNCDVSLTMHMAGEAPAEAPLRCHYCRHQAAAPACCPNCGGRHIRYFGAGTQRVEEAARDLFPEARILRMDVDTTVGKGAHERIYHQFRRGEADILVGTQMVAKGWDIGGVTLVGVISADTSLHLPDFRSAERTFQLLTQVAGRAGRGDVPGEVVVQTYSPEHYAIQAAARHDFAGFYRQELAVRRQLGYPPFGHLARLVAAHPLAREAESLAEYLGRRAAAALAALGEGYELLGPARAPLGRLHGRHRWHLLLKGPDREALTQAVREVVAGAAGATGPGTAPSRPGGVRLDGDAVLSVDLDPVQML